MYKAPEHYIVALAVEREQLKFVNAPDRQKGLHTYAASDTQQTLEQRLSSGKWKLEASNEMKKSSNEKIFFYCIYMALAQWCKNMKWNFSFVMKFFFFALFLVLITKAVWDEKRSGKIKSETHDDDYHLEFIVICFDWRRTTIVL